jgi:ABC-type lipoprotein export system ATPase subunit
MRARGGGGRERRRRAEAALDELGLADLASRTPSKLSGGEQQRVAIARALVNNPLVLLADEPTGALDTATSKEIMSILKRLNRESRLTILLVTHEPDIAACAGRVVTIRDGRVIADERLARKQRRSRRGQRSPNHAAAI